MGFEGTTNEGNTPSGLVPMFDSNMFAFPQAYEKLGDFEPKLHQKVPFDEPAEFRT